MTEECAVCGQMMLVAPRLFDKGGHPVCEDCRCECCGQPPDCDCEITVVDGYSRETGPYEDRGCLTHRRSV